MNSVKPSRVLVIDPGFDSPTGHHLPHNLAMRGYCVDRGIPCTIYGAVNRPELHSHVGGVSIFRGRLYREQRDMLDVMAKAAAGNRAFYEDMVRIGPVAATDLVLMHTANHLQLAGLAAWLNRLPRPRPRVRVILRYQPEFLVDADGPPLVEHLYSHALHALVRAARGVRLYSDSVNGAAYYARLSGAPVAVLPVLADFVHMQPEGERPLREGPSRFLFVGEARPEKGFYLLPEALRLARRERPGLQLLVHCTRANAKVVAALRALGAHVQEGKVLRERYYFEKLREADAVLLAYDPARYRTRVTYVLTETIGAGRAVLATGAGSSMQSQLQTMDPMPGVLIDDFSAPALARAMVAFDDRRLELVAAARRHAQPMREKNSVVQYFNMLFSDAPAPVVAPPARAPA